MEAQIKEQTMADQLQASEARNQDFQAQLNRAEMDKKQKEASIAEKVNTLSSQNQ